MDSIKSGTALANPLTSQLSGVNANITTLLSSPVQAIRDLATSMQNSINAASKAAADVASSLQTRLPLMKAADSISAKINLTQSLSAPTGPGAAFSAVFGPVTDAKNQLTSLQNSLTPAAMAKLTSGDTSLVSGLTSQASTMQSTVSSSVGNATSSATSAIGDLKAYAFAKFCSMPQPPHVQDVINSCSSIQINKELAAQGTQTAAKIYSQVPDQSAVLTSQSQPAPSKSVLETTDSSLGNLDRVGRVNANLAKIGYPGSTALFDFEKAYFDYVDPLSDAAIQEKKALNAKAEQCVAWKNANYPDYAAVKQAAKDNPNDTAAQQKYQQYKSDFETRGGTNDFDAMAATYNTHRAEVLRLKAQFNAWLANDFADAKAGPPW